MGELLDGVWHDTDEARQRKGRFIRHDSVFRNWITQDGSPGPTGESGFRAEGGRYHLYVAWACPWAHRTLIFRKLKRLEELVSVSIVDPLMRNEGWVFSDRNETIPDTVNGVRCLYEIYLKANPTYTGRVTVPTLWDKQRGTIVSNESAEIIRMFNEAFNGITGDRQDFYPEPLRPAIDRVNDLVYETVNNGVYSAGFATDQGAYEEAFDALFETLDMLEEQLSHWRYLTGGTVTEADWRLFPTLIRFDAVYYGHFKCNLRRIADYPNLCGYMRELYQWPGIADTVRMEQTKLHYYGSHASVNPTGIVPKGPALNFGAPHGRDKLEAEVPVVAQAR